MISLRTGTLIERADNIIQPAKIIMETLFPQKYLQVAASIFMMAIRPFVKKNYKQSIVYYRKALKQIPTFFEVHNNLGISLAHTNCFSQAIECLQKATKLLIGQSQVNPFHNLVNAYLKSGNYDEGIRLLLKLMTQRKSEETIRMMKFLIIQLNGFHHYLLNLIKAQHKTLQSSVVEQLSRIYRRVVDEKMMIIRFGQNQAIIDKIEWRQLMETYDQLHIQYHKLPNCSKQHQYCQLYHKGLKLAEHLSKVKSLQTRKILSLLCAYTYAKEQTIALSWYYFSYIDQLQQCFLLNLLNNMMSKNNKSLLALKKSNFRLIQSLVVKISHKRIHQQREQCFILAKQHKNQEVIVSQVLKLYFLQCYDYIMPLYQSDLNQQDMLSCVSVIARAHVIDNPSGNRAVEYLKDISKKNPSLQCELSYQIGIIYYLFGRFQQALSFFKKVIQIGGRNPEMKLLITQCYFKIDSKHLIMQQFKTQLKQHLVSFEGIDFQYQRKRMTAEVYKQTSASLIMNFVLNKQLDNSYKLFCGLIQTFAQDSKQLKDIGHLLLFKKAIFLRVKQGWTYQASLQLQLYVILALKLSNQEEVILQNLMNLFQEDDRLFEACQLKLSQKHKTIIYSQMTQYCKKSSINNFYVFKIQKMVRCLSNEAIIQSCQMTKQLKFVFLQSIKQRFNSIQRNSEKWISKNILSSFNRQVSGKQIHKMLKDLKQKQKQLAISTYFQQKYKQICLLMPKFYSGLNKEEDSMKLFRKIINFQRIWFIFSQFMKDSNFCPHEQESEQSNYTTVSLDKMGSSKWLICIFQRYQKESNEDQLWKDIRNFINEDYIPENSTISQKSKSPQEYSDQGKCLLQCTDQQSLVKYHIKHMKTFLYEMCNSVYFSQANQVHQKGLDNLSLKQDIDLLSFVGTLIMQLEANSIIIPSLQVKIKTISKTQQIFTLPKDTLFLKLRSYRKEQEKIYQSTCCIMKCYLSLIEQGRQSQSALKKINNLSLSPKQLPLFQSCKRQKINACLRLLQSKMKSHHFGLFVNFIKKFLQKNPLRQGNQNIMRFYFNLLQERKINYKKFIQKMSSRYVNKEITSSNKSSIISQSKSHKPLKITLPLGNADGSICK